MKIEIVRLGSPILRHQAEPVEISEFITYYAIVKSTIYTKFPKYALTIDAGIGSNFMRADDFKRARWME
jgi:hypothetical protein